MASVRKQLGKNFVLPILVWAMILLVFLNVKNLPFQFSEKDQVVLRYAVKCIMTILLPFALIHILYKDRRDFGLYFPKLIDSFKLSIKSYAIAGPAGITFLLIGWLGWEIQGWLGATTLSAVYLMVCYFIPIVTKKLPSRNAVNNRNTKIQLAILGSLITLVIAYFTYEYIPILSKILYYIFIVGLGEELLFRGYIQSSFNRFFGKPFQLGNVQFGWGIVWASVLFGLMHALVVVPPLWPWAVFTFVLGLALGFVREKDGSILSAVLLHAMIDMPLVIFSV